MPRPTRLSLLLIPLSFLLLTQALPGRAQQAPSVRFAFADTTLLRDTLDLHFDRLFPVADSLQLSPDTLRALMVRFRLTMPRILHLADSLSVTVDSVGAFMDRQKLNPLAGGRGKGTSNDFTYTSGYDIQKTSTTWTNGSTYKLLHGPVYVTNGTNIELQRILSGGNTSLRQNREATTEAGLTVNKGLSFGARSYQLRVFSADPGASTATDDEKKSEYGLTSRAVTTGRRLSSELNLRSGYLDDRSAIAIKRGASGSADARLRFVAAGLLTHDLSGSISGNLSHTRSPGEELTQSTNDLSTNLRGTLVLLPNSPARVNINYGLRNSSVETPVADGRINRIRQSNNNADGTMRLRKDNDHYVDLNGSLGRSSSYTGTSYDGGAKATVRWTLLGGALDGNIDDSRSTKIYPEGYDQHGVSRSADATLARNFGPMFIGRMVANVELDQSRFVRRRTGATPSADNDAYRQSLRTELNYAPPSQRLSSRVAGQVSLNRSISLTSATSSNNTDTRSYRGEWSWSYRLMHSLTATQNNQLQADYLLYPFAPDRNSLALSYNTNTSLSAALPGNLSIDVAHNVSQAPRGSYTRQPDGINSLLLSDETRNRALTASLRYAPFSGISLHVDPRYSDAERSGTVNGVQAKQRADLRLDFAGGVDVNLHVGRKGTLTGRVNRSYSDQRTINYQDGLGVPTPRSQTDYWNGNLQFTWTL